MAKDQHVAKLLLEKTQVKALNEPPSMNELGKLNTISKLHSPLLINVTAFLSCVSSLTSMARTFLEKSTWKNDLSEIARHTFNWEECTLFGFTGVEIQDIKARHPENYEMQW